MSTKNETLARRSAAQDPFGLLRQMTSDFDRMFEGFGAPAFRWPLLRARPQAEAANWLPEIDVFEKDNRLVTRVDLPGMKKDDVKVEIADGQLLISGERKSEVEEKKDKFYRSERQYGSFYRAVPLPEGVKLEDVQATFADGVLEVSIPLPPAQQAKSRTVEVKEAPKPATKTAAA
jgi:HSP20 family protein